MLFSAPLFMVLAWWAGRAPGAKPFRRRDWAMIAWLGFIGYYVASLLDFIGLAYITAALERLVLYLYPTMVLLLSAVMLRKRITRHAVVALILSYTGIALVFTHDLAVQDDAIALWTGGGLVFASAFCYALYLVSAGAIIARLGSMRFVSWAMLTSSVFVLGHFAATREISLLRVPLSIYGIMVAMAVFSTVVPTLLIAEAVKRLGANTSSLIGSLGPIFTIGLGALILGESVYAIQLVGAALVLAGVMLVTYRTRDVNKVERSATITSGT
jgi:drug/metabolite transporter (DMT)-like permease